MFKINFFLLFFLSFVLSGAFFEVGRCSDNTLANGLLIAQIKGDNYGLVELNKNTPHKLHFVLKAYKNDVIVYEDWNSWGFFARTFTAVDKNNQKIKYEIFRNCNVWTHNFPSTVKIKSGQDFVTDIDFFDGTWSFVPRPSSEKDRVLILQGYFDLEESNGRRVNDIDFKIWGRSWFGHLVTNKIEIKIPKGSLKYFYKPNPW